MRHPTKHKTAGRKRDARVRENPLGRPHEFEGFPSAKATSYVLQAMHGKPPDVRPPPDHKNYVGVERFGANTYGTWGRLCFWENNHWVPKGYTLEPRPDAGKGPIPIGPYSYHHWMSPSLRKTLRLF